MSSFVKYSITFLVGVYIGQEFGGPGGSIPNVKKYTLNTYKEIMKSDIMKEIKKDLK